MDGAVPQIKQGMVVLLGSIAFVAIKPIPGINAMVFMHQPVPNDFCTNGGHHDFGNLGIGFHHGFIGNG